MADKSCPICDAERRERKRLLAAHRNQPYMKDGRWDGGRIGAEDE